MDKQEQEYTNTDGKQRGGFGKGLIFLLIGAFLLVRNLHLDIPSWIMSWQMLLIVIGLVVWSKSEFKNIGGMIMMLVGGIFLAKEFFWFPFDFARFVWPAIFIVIGLCLMFSRNIDCKRKNPRYKLIKNDPTDDWLEASMIFSGENRIVVSKNLKGGRLSAIFGGIDVNLLQADFHGTIEIDATCVFGGLELIVPSNWNVKVDMTTIMGGVEDKRPVELIGNNPDKVLIIRGSCVFGGVEIKSYA